MKLTNILKSIALFIRGLFGSGENDKENDCPKILISAAIDEYPDSWNCDLSYCLKGQERIAKKAAKYGYKSILLNNELATWENFGKEVMNAFEQCKSGGQIILHHSHHGLQVPDTNGDEEDGYDEAILLYADNMYDGVVTDDMYNDLLSYLPEGVDLLVIFDSCHSDTGTKGEGVVKSKSTKLPFIEISGKLKKRFAVKGGIRWNVFAAAEADKTTMDSPYDFTYWLCKTAKKGQSFGEWGKAINESAFVTYYGQTPVAEGDKNTIFFN